ncbi:MAG: HK97 gp10 family phage protein [bacterium]|nr:HK97 gp10 family phage protein [bacterium]
MNIYQLIRELNAAPAKMAIAAQSALNAEVPRLITDFRKRSPVDTGEYRRSWRKINTSSSSPGAIAGVTIANEDPKASLMEYGSDTNEPPWYYPQKGIKTGKLAVSGGMVWAGGLNPGHTFTIGGAIDPVLFKNNARQLKIANQIADKIIKVI